jgi:hypothetical protein
MVVQSLTKEEHVQRHNWRYQIMKKINKEGRKNWTCTSFVNDCTAIIWYDCTAIIWYAGYKLVIDASLRTAIVSKLTFKFALPLIQQNRSFSITDLLVNDVILISSWCYIVLLVASSHQYTANNSRKLLY